MKNKVKRIKISLYVFIFISIVGGKVSNVDIFWVLTIVSAFLSQISTEKGHKLLIIFVFMAYFMPFFAYIALYFSHQLFLFNIVSIYIFVKFLNIFAFPLTLNTLLNFLSLLGFDSFFLLLFLGGFGFDLVF